MYRCVDSIYFLKTYAVFEDITSENSGSGTDYRLYLRLFGKYKKR